MIRPRKLIRRRQGMTEYIVIVGLVALLLIAAVTKFKDTIEVTIMGSGSNKGMAGQVGELGDSMDPGGPTGGEDDGLVDEANGIYKADDGTFHRGSKDGPAVHRDPNTGEWVNS